MAKIGINALSIVPGQIGGGETYIKNLIRSLATIDSENLYTVFVRSEAADYLGVSAANFSQMICKMPGHDSLFRVLWEQVALPIYVRRLNLDVMHFPANTMPLIMKVFSDTRTIITAHDFSSAFYLANFPQYGKGGNTYLVRLDLWLRKLSCRFADLIVVDAEFGRREVIKYSGSNERKVTVVYLANAPLEAGGAQPGDVLLQLKVQRPYLLYVGTIAKHKNIESLVLAFDRFTARCNRPDTMLVLVGRLGSSVSAEISKLLRQVNCRVRITGYLPDEQLAVLYQNARGFILPSLYEGFGIPVLEAMSFGLPVAASNAGSLPELVGDVGILFEPENLTDIERAIEILLTDDDCRTLAQQRAPMQAAKFSWRATAEKMRTIYEAGCNSTG